MKPIIIFLDDNEIDLLINKRMIQELWDKEIFKINFFSQEADAIDFIIKNGDSIAAIFQDSNRPESEIIKGWRKSNNSITKTYKSQHWYIFYHYVIDTFCPEACTIFHGAGYEHNEIEIIQKWGERDSRLIFYPKPFRDENGKLLEQISNNWNQLSKGKAITTPNQKLVAFLNEELAVLFAKYPDLLEKITPRKFEEFIGSIFKNQGYSIELTQKTKDGGYDILACSNSKLNEPIIIEVKHTHTQKPVKVGIVRALYGVKTLNKFNKAILVTSNFVSDYAKREFSRVIPHEIEFMENDNIVEWCKKYAKGILEQDSS